MRNFGIKHSGCIPYWHVNIDRYSERGATPLREPSNTRTSWCQFSKHRSSFQANKVIFANKWASINANTVVFVEIFQVLEQRIPQLLLKSLDTCEFQRTHTRTNTDVHLLQYTVSTYVNNLIHNLYIQHPSAFYNICHTYRRVSVFIELSSVSSYSILY